MFNVISQKIKLIILNKNPISACRMENIFISAPESCLRCSEKRSVGDTYTETVPQKMADVVFVVDLGLGAQTMTDLVQPSVNMLRNQLKNRDFQEANINVAVIGYRKDLKYPHRFTTNGKLDFTGKLTIPDDTDMVKDTPPALTGNEKLDKTLLDAFKYEQKVKEDLGIGADGRAFQEAYRYPFRSTAARAIIAFRSDHLTHSWNPVYLYLAKLLSVVLSFCITAETNGRYINELNDQT